MLFSKRVFAELAGANGRSNGERLLVVNLLTVPR